MFRNRIPLAVAMITTPLAGLLATLVPRADADDKEFTPIVEAKMPSGFPAVTPVREVRVKHYPAYRKALADASPDRAFWTLFSHIKQNDVAMTAPVEMGYAEQDRPKEASMAFLYGSSDLGSAGRHGNVEVVDVPAMTVVSTGVRGPRNADSVAAARARLTAWLDANQQGYVAAGPLRVMAYNSPFVPRNRNFFEVEIPLRSVEAELAGNSQ